MRTIKWAMPFTNMNYLLSLTEELASNPFIYLITGVEDERGNIEACNITVKEVENMDEVLLYIGATIGAHSVAYAMELMPQLIEQCKCISKSENDVIFLPEVAGSFAEEAEAMARIEESPVVEEGDDLFNEAEEIINIEEIPDSKAKQLLRSILANFKK